MITETSVYPGLRMTYVNNFNSEKAICLLSSSRVNGA